jgi:hypothetical protein
MFQNAINGVNIASPLNEVDTPTNGAASARIGTPPDNSAQTAAFTGGLNLPFRTRIMGTASRSWLRQNDDLLPQTSNTLLATDPLLVLPRTTFDGQARTSNMSVSASSRPAKSLRLSARFRSFDYSNQTTPFHIQAMAISDRSIDTGEDPTSEAHPFTKNNTDVSASYEFAKALSVTAGYGYETWKRDPAVRNIEKTTEGMPKVSVDFTGIDWVTLRGSYSKGTRRGDNYQDSTSDFQSFDFPGFRRFDMGPRDRVRSALVAEFVPADQITFSISWQDWNDKFPAAFGVQRDKSDMIGADADWSANSRFSVGAGYSIENIDYVLKTRYKTGARGTPTFDNPTWIWFSVDKGKSTVTYASFSAVLVPNKLDALGSFSYAHSRFQDRNYNPTTPTGGRGSSTTPSRAARTSPTSRSSRRSTFTASWPASPPTGRTTPTWAGGCPAPCPPTATRSTRRAS